MASSACDFSLIDYQVDKAIATITLNRAEKGNAFNAQMIAELTQAFTQVQADEALSVLCLKASGKHFCAGADLKWMQAAAGYTQEDNKKDAEKLAQLMQSLAAVPVPVLTCVQGAAMGGAIGLVALSDIVIAEDTARFCLSEVKLGLVPAVVGPYVIAALGARQAKRFMLTAETINAQMAWHFGLIQQVVPSGDLGVHQQHWQAQLAQNGPQALRAVKKMCHDLAGMSATAQQAHTVDLIAQIRAGNEAQEGIQAFFDKRDPDWK